MKCATRGAVIAYARAAAFDRLPRRMCAADDVSYLSEGEILHIRSRCPIREKVIFRNCMSVSDSWNYGRDRKYFVLLAR